MRPIKIPFKPLKWQKQRKPYLLSHLFPSTLNPAYRSAMSIVVNSTFSSLRPKTLISSLSSSYVERPPSRVSYPSIRNALGRTSFVAMAVGVGESSSRRIGGSSTANSNEPRETIMLPGCDYNHWLIVLEFPKDPAPTREQMIDTYLNTLCTVLGSMEEAKKNMYAFSTTTYTGFQCTVDEETSEKFKGLPGVLWVLPDSYIDVKNKDYGGDKYVNGEIIPCKYPTYQPKQRRSSKYESRRYERRRSAPSAESPNLKQESPQSGSSTN